MKRFLTLLALFTSSGVASASPIVAKPIHLSLMPIAERREVLAQLEGVVRRTEALWKQTILDGPGTVQIVEASWAFAYRLFRDGKTVGYRLDVIAPAVMTEGSGDGPCNWNEERKLYQGPGCRGGWIRERIEVDANFVTTKAMDDPEFETCLTERP
jgi:hypothetical protein